MRCKETDAAQMAARRQSMLEAGYRLFSEKSIDKVSMPDVARESGCGIATLYRYFSTKLELVVGVGTWAWEHYLDESVFPLPDEEVGPMTAAELLETYLNCFLDLYRNHSDLLRFNQFFNVYVRGEEADEEQMAPYMNMIRRVERGFRRLYLKAQADGTVRTDILWEEMFTETLHIMLAVATRYAVGLVYTPERGTSAERELTLVRQLLLERYTRHAVREEPKALPPTAKTI
ncbi:MAG: TetR/AcrR family transcriptional regulator [Oscillospiraceae bacterium]|nr:TetR/AcrR family transcriptional regulator [Oscillospiraceae bacterium]